MKHSRPLAAAAINRQISSGRPVASGSGASRSPASKGSMRQRLFALAAAAALAGPSKLYAVDPATYLFYGCILDVSCHEVTLTVTPSSALPDQYLDISSLIFSQFLVPARVYSFDLESPTNDFEFGVYGSAFGPTVGPRADYETTYADAGWTPGFFHIVVGVAGPEDENAFEQRDLRDIYLTPVTAFPDQPPFTTVPEPGTMALLATGLAAIGIGRRRRRS